jgi:hypothetical protein
VTSFLGDLALGDDNPVGLAWAAIVLFLVAAGLVAWVLLPRPEWYFSSRPSVIIRGYVEDHPSAPLWAMHKQLAEHFEADLDANTKYMKPLFRAYQWANVALAGEVAFWILILVWR